MYTKSRNSPVFNETVVLKCRFFLKFKTAFHKKILGMLQN
jgi:hypothetical protein